MEQWLKSVNNSFKEGARASCVELFVSAGAASYGLWAIWPDPVLDRLSDPQERARLAVLVESALPGWLWSASKAPVPDNTKAWAYASYALIPPDQTDESIVGRATSRAKESSMGAVATRGGELAKALGILDEFAGLSSWRARVDGFWSPIDLGGRYAQRKESLRPLPDHLAGSFGDQDFANALCAQACKKALEEESYRGVNAGKPLRM